MCYDCEVAIRDGELLTDDDPDLCRNPDPQNSDMGTEVCNGPCFVDSVVGEVDGQLIEGFQRSCQYLSSGPCMEGVVELQNGLTRARHCCEGNLCTIEPEPDQFMCDNGQLIDLGRQCDGQSDPKFDCIDGSDEKMSCLQCYDCEAVTRDGELWAGNLTTCNDPAAFRDEVPTVSCNGQCYIRVSEGTLQGVPITGIDRGCSRRYDAEQACREGEVSGTGEPVTVTQQCCSSNRCNVFNPGVEECSEAQFTCVNGSIPCVSLDHVCNNNMDCEDGSDEVDCGQCYGCMYSERGEVEESGSQSDCEVPQPDNEDLLVNCNGDCVVVYTMTDDSYTIRRACFPPGQGECEDDDDVNIEGEESTVTTRCCQGQLCNNLNPRTDSETDAGQTLTTSLPMLVAIVVMVIVV